MVHCINDSSPPKHTHTFDSAGTKFVSVYEIISLRHVVFHTNHPESFHFPPPNKLILLSTSKPVVALLKTFVQIQKKKPAPQKKTYVFDDTC